MTVGRISMLCWIVFVVMCLGFLPLAAGMVAVTKSVPPVPRDILVGVVTIGLWWGPFAYAMYLTMAVVKNGDKRLLKRGIHGTATVLSGRATNEVIQSGEFAWEAPRVYKYKLQVTIPGGAPYETSTSICATGIAEGSTVDVAVSPHNHKRVTIDVGQATEGAKRGSGARPMPDVDEIIRQARAASGTGATSPTIILGGQVLGGAPKSENAERIDELTKLGQLHSQGVLSDEEFATEKARVLGS